MKEENPGPNFAREIILSNATQGLSFVIWLNVFITIGIPTRPYLGK